MKSKTEIAEKTKDGISASSWLLAIIFIVSLIIILCGGGIAGILLLAIPAIFSFWLIRLIVHGYIYARGAFEMLTADLDTDPETNSKLC